MSISNDWKNWIAVNQKKIDTGFEREFVEKILSNLIEISPSDVIAQFHFKDSHGGNRYIDFMIENERQGFRLPIELDGLAKDQTHLKWNDFLRRQNDLHLAVGPVLRFTNAQLHHRSSDIIDSIRVYLRKQTLQKKLRDNLIREVKELRRTKEQAENHNVQVKINREKYEESVAEKNLLLKKLADKEHALQLQKSSNLNDFSAIERKLEESLTIVGQLNKEREGDMRHVIWASALVMISLVAVVAYLINSKSKPTLVNPTALIEEKPQPTNRNPTVLIEEKSKPTTLNSTSISNEASKLTTPTRVFSIDVAKLPANYLGKNLQVCGTVRSVNSKQPNVSYMNLGAPYPNQHVGIVILGTARSTIDVSSFMNKKICATGLLEKTKRGDLKIEVISSNQLNDHN